ncbi:MAG: Thioredoxin [Owenweeksia sp. TMED14]|nr:MAG: Thioredoxin [Owenweeksia sp. TMED14]|tara:strand:- start:2694 stop:3005 length:312 start_codon:yes stop_codon:yes gene_type:complete
MLELNEDNLGEILSQHEKVMVQYGAGWCGNCRIMKPKFKKFANENEAISFYYVDAEKYPNSRKFADVSNLPTFAAFKLGRLFKQVQTNKADVLKDLVDEIANN